MTSIQPQSQFARRLAELLSHYPNIKLAILFGSQANPERQKHFGSDIDLAIMTDAPISDRFKMELMEAISTEFGCPVDVVDYLCAQSQPYRGPCICRHVGTKDYPPF